MRSAACYEPRHRRRRIRAASCKRGRRWLGSHPAARCRQPPWLGEGSHTGRPSGSTPFFRPPTLRGERP
eukprot:1611599-Lingulodinium_polyedra.AAC.1